MIQAIFFLNFRSQLSRTRPQLLENLESLFTREVKAGGGRITRGRRILIASFEEDTVGIRLGMAMLSERVLEELKRASRDLYGSCIVLCQKQEDYEAESLCRELVDRDGGASLWCDSFLHQALESYGKFEGEQSTGYRRLREWKKTKSIPEEQVFPYREKIVRVLIQAPRKNTLLVGPPFMGKRDALRQYCARFPCSAPPLTIRFGTGGEGLACLADACTPEMLTFLDPRRLVSSRSGSAEKTPKPAADMETKALEELIGLQELLFRERLRDDCSPHGLRLGRRFLQLLLELYLVRANFKNPVLILENLLQADESAGAIFRDVYGDLRNRRDLLVLGTAGFGNEEDIKKWTPLFPKVLKFSLDELPRRGGATLKDLPGDLLDITYTISLLGRFLPAFLFPRAFEDASLNPALLEKALEMLLHLGIIDTVEDPRPRISDFFPRAEKLLDPPNAAGGWGTGRRERIRGVVRNLLLAWVDQGKLAPCFNLLKILSDLGGQGDEALILNGIYSDTVNGTWKGIVADMDSGRFDELIGRKNAPILRFIFRTQRALVYGNREEIIAAFQEQVPEQTASPCYRARIMANLTSWYLGIGNTSTAAETVKETFMLNQSLKTGLVPAYRLFALVNLVNNRVSDAVEYIGFAIEEAERKEQFDELVKASYFGGGIFFLFGNISRAIHLVSKAEGLAAAQGYGEWNLRCRFLRGKLYFEAGLYDKALELFESLSREPGITKEQASLLSAWIFRGKAFLVPGRREIPESPVPPEGGDLRLFSLEAAYLRGDYEAAAAQAEQLISELELDSGGMNFIFTEQPDWRSGFDQCEHLTVRSRVLGLRLATIYGALARCKLGALGSLLGSLQQLLREELQDDSDPYGAFYYYAYYLILKDIEAAQVDMNTAVSMAFKRLQRRASRIDDLEIRQSYLSSQYWNRILGAAAKEYKLI